MGKSLKSETDLVSLARKERRKSLVASLLNFSFVIAGLTIIGLATPYVDLVLGSRLTGAHLSSAALTFLLFAICLRALLVRFGLIWSWSDLLLAYSVWHFCSALSSSGFVGFLFPMVAAFRYFSNPANQWEQLFGSFIPSWFALIDESAANAFYHGIPSPSPIQWQPWLFPTLFWLLFATVYFAGAFFLGLWLQRRWIVDEKLAFPTVQIVQAVAQSPSAIRLLSFWVGAILTFAIHSLNSASRHLTYLPSVPLRFSWGQVLTDFPFDIWQGEQTAFSFALTGIGYLIPSEVALSFWGFYWVHLLIRFLLRWRGVPPGVGTGGITTLQRAQEAGGFIVLACVLLMPSLKHSKQFTERLGLISWLICMAILVTLLWFSGMRVFNAIFFLAVWTSVHLVLTRVVNAGGVMRVECSFTPWDIVARTLGVHRVGWRDLTVMAFPQQIFMFDQVTIPLPYLMDGFKLAKEVPFTLGRFAIMLGIGYLATLFVSVPFNFWLCHRWGALSLNGWFTVQEPSWAFNKLQSWMAAPFGVDLPFVQNMFIGGVMMAGLIFLHRQFLWWNLSPLGFVMSSTATMRSQWFPLFAGWFIRTVVLRLKGLRGYQSLRPFFVGLVWGELISNAIWVGINAFLGGRNLTIFPPD
ncbi:MAG: hypothetical protein NZ937_03265 [Armatimonadetes bacterium]|nr:hypothetical protein [Armatimonadota bacterium]